MQPNPYQAPVESHGPALTQDGQVLATRGARFWGSVIDGVASVVVVLPIQWAFGVFSRAAAGGLPWLDQALWGVFGIVVWFVIQVAFLRQGQTLGKRMIGTRIVDYTTGETPPVSHLVLWRYVPLAVVANIPVVGPFLAMIDPLFIFGSEQRCVHDLVAHTKVVVAS